MHLNNPKSPAAQGQERPTRSQISHIYTTEISQKVLLRLPNPARPDLRSCNSRKALQICRYPHPCSAGQRRATTANRSSHVNANCIKASAGNGSNVAHGRLLFARYNKHRDSESCRLPSSLVAILISRITRCLSIERYGPESGAQPRAFEDG